MVLEPSGLWRSSIHLYLSRNTLYMRWGVHPLHDFIRQARATYTWGQGVKVSRSDNKFALSDTDQLPDFSLFFQQDPVNVLNWLDPPDDFPRLLVLALSHNAADVQGLDLHLLTLEHAYVTRRSTQLFHNES